MVRSDFTPIQSNKINYMGENKLTREQAVTFENLVKAMQAITLVNDMPAEVHFCENYAALMKIKYKSTWYCYYVNAEGTLFHFTTTPAIIIT